MGLSESVFRMASEMVSYLSRAMVGVFFQPLPRMVIRALVGGRFLVGGIGGSFVVFF